MNGFLRCTWIGWAMLVSAGVQADDKPGTHRVVQISDKTLNQPCEVSVSINPTNPKHIVASSIHSGKPGAPGYGGVIYFSTDGGLTWKHTFAPSVPDRTHGDDLVAFGLDGTVYNAHIAFDGIRVERPLKASSGIFVASSADGLVWKQPVPVVDHINSCEPMEDKPWIAIDNNKDSPHRGSIYIAWTRFDVYGSKDPAHKSHIYFARSKDGGKSFQVPSRISDTPGDCLDDDNTVEGAVPAVGPGGEVYVAWAGPKGLVFKKSVDGGWKWTKEKVVTELEGGWNFPIEGLGRANGMPVTGVDCSTGKHRGSIYINWIDNRHKDPDVFVIASRDGGATWGKPVRVNDDPQGNGKTQFFTWMAVDPADGSINVLFFDRRDATDTRTSVYLARSVDGGQTFVNYKAKQEPFTCQAGVFFGDYNGVAAQSGRVVGVYPHFVERSRLAVSAAVFRFKPGTQEQLPVDSDK